MTTAEAEAIIDQHLPQDGPPLVAPGKIASALGVTLTTIAAMGADGRLPPPVRLSSTSTRYPRLQTRVALLRILTGGAAPK